MGLHRGRSNASTNIIESFVEHEQSEDGSLRAVKRWRLKTGATSIEDLMSDAEIYGSEVNVIDAEVADGATLDR